MIHKVVINSEPAFYGMIKVSRPGYSEFLDGNCYEMHLEQLQQFGKST
jgi:hypothetical protein